MAWSCVPGFKKTLLLRGRKRKVVAKSTKKSFSRLNPYIATKVFSAMCQKCRAAETSLFLLPQKYFWSRNMAGAFVFRGGRRRSSQLKHSISGSVALIPAVEKVEGAGGGRGGGESRMTGGAGSAGEAVAP